MFPEGDNEGLYHTGDATSVLPRRLALRQNDERPRDAADAHPKLLDVVDHHLLGTRFNIHVDPLDGLLTQGAEGYQLTWMDAKVDGWVVTPRRAQGGRDQTRSWYNACASWNSSLIEEKDDANARRMDEHASRARKSFNETLLV